MPCPTHGDGCETVTYRTHCQRCGHRVFYFSCSEGSKVFFDSLGDPWPRHEDSCPAQAAQRFIAETGTPPAVTRGIIRAHARDLGIQIPQSVLQSLDEIEFSASTSPNKDTAISHAWVRAEAERAWRQVKDNYPASHRDSFIEQFIANYDRDPEPLRPEDIEFDFSALFREQPPTV